jgi:hypothetical protein
MKKVTSIAFRSIAVIIVFVIVGNLRPDIDNTPQAIERRKEKAAMSRILHKYPYLPMQSAYDGSVRAVRAYLENTLNDPESYTPAEWGQLTNYEGKFYVSHSFRAKNKFGGMVLQDWTFTIDSAGAIVQIVDSK